MFALIDQPVDSGQNFIALIDSQCTTGAEIILHINDEKGMTDHKMLLTALMRL
jgi:hypothetical protein